MTNHKQLSFLLLILLGGTSLFSQVMPYQFQREITDVRTIGYHRIVLPAEVLSELKDDLSDLRIYQVPAGDSLPLEEVPYLVEVQEGTDEYQKVPFRMINQASRREFSQAVMRKEADGTINHIQLELNKRNFDVRASLEGSENRLSWVTIKDDFRLVGIANGEVSYSYTTLNFTDSDYRFFRVRLYDPELTVSAAEMNIWKQEEGRYQTFEISKWDPKNDTDKKITEVRIDLTDRYPVSQVQLDIGSTRDYFRPARLTYLKQRIETDQGPKEVWREFATSMLSSMEEADIIAPYRFTEALTLTIENYDDLPLNIQSLQVSGPVYELITELEVGNEYILAYSNANASRPRYDLVHFRNQIPWDDLVPAGLGAEVEPVDEEAEKKEKAEASAKRMGNVLLWAVMLLVIAVIGFVTVRMMRKSKENQTEADETV